VELRFDNVDSGGVGHGAPAVIEKGDVGRPHTGDVFRYIYRPAGHVHDDLVLLVTDVVFGVDHPAEVEVDRGAVDGPRIADRQRAAGDVGTNRNDRGGEKLDGALEHRR